MVHYSSTVEVYAASYHSVLQTSLLSMMFFWAFLSMASAAWVFFFFFFIKPVTGALLASIRLPHLCTPLFPVRKHTFYSLTAGRELLLLQIFGCLFSNVLSSLSLHWSVHRVVVRSVLDLLDHKHSPQSAITATLSLCPVSRFLNHSIQTCMVWKRGYTRLLNVICNVILSRGKIRIK